MSDHDEDACTKHHRAINLFFDLPLSDDSDDREVFHAIIEIPKHSRIKYEFNEKFNTIFVDRVFRTPVNYPQNYGFFPQTWNKYDQDPADVIVISSDAFLPGVVVPVRVVGIIELEDTGELDHKLIAVPTGLSDHTNCMDITELDNEIVENLKWFLKHYKFRDSGETLNVLGSKGREDALKFLRSCHKEFKRREGKKKQKQEMQHGHIGPVGRATRFLRKRILNSDHK
jgi:inorganic pyrophosphatase